MTEAKIIDYPVWQVAMKNILTEIETSGHGVLFTHEQLKHWMGVKEPKTVDEVKEFGFDYMQGMDSLKTELLFEHQVFLENSRGVGYIALLPDDQVTKTPDKYVKKARNEINRAAAALTNVKEHLLSIEADNRRIFNMARIAFLKSAFNKRRIVDVPKIEA